MQLNEIKVGGIYKATLNVQFRSEKDINPVDFFIKVTGKTSKGLVEVSFLHDHSSYLLEPWQLTVIN